MDNKKLDCLLVGYKEVTLEERRLMAKGNIAALNYCKHEYIEYENKMWFYDDFLTEISKKVDGDIYKISEIPYLGIMYLENYLKNRNITVSAYNHFDFYKDLIDKEIETKQITVIAISAVFYTSPIPIIRLVNYYKKKVPKAKIVVGGAYVTNEFETKTKDKIISEFKIIGADYYIYDSQGEQTLVNIIENIKSGRSCNDVPNIVVCCENEVSIHDREKEFNDLNCDVIDYTKLSTMLQFSTLNLRTARGCPNRCRFCNYPVRNPKLELQTYENIEKQLYEVYSMDRVKNIVFIDDSFNMPLKRFKEICRKMIEHGAKKPWYSYFRMSHCDEEAVRLMKESNCQGVFLGVESADDTVLENMNKRVTTEQYTVALDLLKKYGITTFAYFLIGFPGETDETIKKNIDLLNSKKIDFYSFNLWYAESNTPIYNYKDEFKLEGEGFRWKHYTMDSIEAAKKMDYIYEKVNESIYIPGENFSFWGVPYLLGKGFDMKTIKILLSSLRSYILSKDMNEKRTIINKISVILKR